ncbi:hypothetical protein GCM10022378_08550 [Salinicoccus jeotgali]|uniref:HTH tetR-type domain-containing protein n=1 Tax=Salinicoccus jeotgali TaxID=381634 RepID=A0ABP7EL23_9STAP
MTKENIINSALQQLAIHGYEGTTMKKIAEASNIKSASIYYFFKNKEDLVNNVLLKVLSGHFKAMTDEYFKYENEELKVRFETLLEKIVRHHRGNQNETAVYLRLMESNNTDFKMEVEQYLKQYNQWLTEKLYRNIKDEYTCKDETAIKDLLETYMLIGNGLFWGSIIYSDSRIEKEIVHAKNLFNLAMMNMLEEE